MRDKVFRESEVCKDEIVADARSTCERIGRFVCDDMPPGKGKPRAANRVARKFRAFCESKGIKFDN